MKIIGHHTDDAHGIYDHAEAAELIRVHDEANPVSDLLQQLADDQTRKRRAYRRSDL